MDTDSFRPKFGRRANDSIHADRSAIELASPKHALDGPEHEVAPSTRAEELERLYFQSCEPDLIRAAFERRHPVAAFFQRRPELLRGLLLAALAAATIIATIASTFSPPAP